MYLFHWSLRFMWIANTNSLTYSINNKNFMQKKAQQQTFDWEPKTVTQTHIDCDNNKTRSMVWILFWSSWIRDAIVTTRFFSTIECVWCVYPVSAHFYRTNQLCCIEFELSAPAKNMQNCVRMQTKHSLQRRPESRAVRFVCPFI